MRTTLALLMTVAACGDDGGASAIDAGPGGPDGPVTTIDGGGGGETDAGSPDGPIGACGDGVLPTADVTGTEGIAIAPDGTLYYSQSGGVGRVTPGGAAEDDWVQFGGTTVWGLAVDADGTRLYAASPSQDAIYEIDLTAVTAEATPLYEDPANVAMNGLVVGPDGGVYYSDFNAGRVFRVDAASGTRTEVTASPVSAANGLFFASATSLLVEAYSAGEIWRLTLDGAGVESGRELVAELDGSLDGLGRDAQGRWYVTDNGNGRLLRLEADFSNDADPEILLSGITAAANVAWGKGPLDCNDVYVASAGALGRFAAGAPGTP